MKSSPSITSWTYLDKVTLMEVNETLINERLVEGIGYRQAIDINRTGMKEQNEMESKQASVPTDAII